MPHRQPISEFTIASASVDLDDDELVRRFKSRLVVDESLTRTLVSYQGNRNVPGLRWFKFKEGFSLELVARFLAEFKPQKVLDPFAGIGTVPLATSWHGVAGTGIEIMPVCVAVANAIACAATSLDPKHFRETGQRLLTQLETHVPTKQNHRFLHVSITDCAFSNETEREIASARAFLAELQDSPSKRVLDFACMSILEECSFTRKDGQYLRWGYRSGRNSRSTFDIGAISSFKAALERKLAIIAQDLPQLHAQKTTAHAEVQLGSCLERLKDHCDESCDLVITSPPYANRYDYTRTYALELAWMNIDKAAFSDLRQRMLSATVENKSKDVLLNSIYSRKEQRLAHANRLYNNAMTLQKIISMLRAKASELSNKNVITLLEGYFKGMALVITELGRIVRVGGRVIMVNENVQYHGTEIPVDFILSKFAEESGFKCVRICKLKRGRGNSSQQMAKFGRREIRKCVYHWVRVND